MESTALIVVQSDRLALLITWKLSSPKGLTNAQAAGIVLVLDQLQANLVLTQHILDVLNLEQMERRFPRHFFTELGPSRMSCTCTRDTVSCLIHLKGNASLILQLGPLEKDHLDTVVNSSVSHVCVSLSGWGEQ